MKAGEDLKQGPTEGPYSVAISMVSNKWCGPLQITGGAEAGEWWCLARDSGCRAVGNRQHQDLRRVTRTGEWPFLPLPSLSKMPALILSLPAARIPELQSAYHAVCHRSKLEVERILFRLPYHVHT